MKRHFLMFMTILAGSALLVSCGPKGEQAQEETPVLSNEAVLSAEGIAGRYEATLPCADCEAMKVSLLLNPDTSYRYDVEYVGKTGDAAHKLEYGKYLVFDGYSRFQLRYRDRSLGEWFKVLDANTLVMQDNAGKDLTDQKLERRVRLISRANGYNLSYIMKNDTSQMAHLVYRRTPQGDIIIDKAFIDAASPQVKAVISWYGMLYETGCKDGACELLTALGAGKYNSDTHRKMLEGNINVGSHDVKSDQSRQLSSMLVTASGPRIVVNYAIIDGNGQNFQGSDMFNLENNVAVLSSHVLSDLKPREAGNAPATNKPTARPAEITNTAPSGNVRPAAPAGSQQQPKKR